MEQFSYEQFFSEEQFSFEPFSAEQFSPEQSNVFNEIRCKSEKRKEIADQIAKLRAEIEKHQEKILEISGKVVKEQAEVVVKQTNLSQKQTKVAQKEEELAQEEAELAQKQAKVAQKEVELAQEEAELAQKQAKVAQKGGELAQEEAELAQKQAKVAQKEEELAQEEAEIAKEQLDIAQDLAEIAKDRMEVAQEQAKILKLDNEILKLSAMDAGLQADVTCSLNRLDEHGARKPVLLVFDKDTLFWGENGSLKLRPKHYKIVKALYFAENHVMEIASLDEIVWGKRKKTPSDATIYTTLSTLNALLKKANCPYRVERIILDLQTVQAQHSESKNTRTVILQPKTKVYALLYEDDFIS